MKSLGTVLLAIGLAVAAWYWLTVEMPKRAQERAAAAETAAIQAQRANSLYRWHDDAGNLQITDEPPKGRHYERISKTPREGMQVDGDRH